MVGCTASVAATLDAGDYVVFPCTFDPKWESEFALSVYSSQNISFRELGATSSIGVDVRRLIPRH
jgi:hypothetical protein